MVSTGRGCADASVASRYARISTSTGNCDDTKLANTLIDSEYSELLLVKVCSEVRIIPIRFFFLNYFDLLFDIFFADLPSEGPLNAMGALMGSQSSFTFEYFSASLVFTLVEHRVYI
jgi:hypothetical protein